MTTSETDLSLALDRLEARAAIAELFADYAHGCDKRTSPDRFLRIWHDDAKYLMPLADRDGIGEIRQALRDIWALTDESHHWITNIVIRFTGRDSAQADADTICYCKLHDGPEVLVSGSYVVDFERRDDEWKIAVCDLDVHWQKAIDLGPADAEGEPTAD